MTTPDPNEYLLARYAEDEAAARRCAEAFPSPWDVSDRGHTVTVRADGPNFWPVTVLEQSPSIDGWLGDYVEHIARHDPARVLADVAVKRAVVDIHCATDMLWGEHVELGCPQCGDPFEGWLWTHPCPTLHALLQPYADREDFPDEWLVE